MVPLKMRVKRFQKLVLHTTHVWLCIISAFSSQECVLVHNVLCKVLRSKFTLCTKSLFVSSVCNKGYMDEADQGEKEEAGGGGGEGGGGQVGQVALLVELVQA